ncbi:MAG: hypothetical protein NT079_04365 [Candidatus Omnitrophica bacterium]|nr:hypothetical protein [Candidatus Omnitrophota bacterium]
MKIDIQTIWDYTNNGQTIIEEIYPTAADGFQRKKNFKIRTDDAKPSCSVFRARGSDVWLFQDKGGNDTKAYNGIQLLSVVKGIDFSDALTFCYEKYVDGKLATVDKPLPAPKITKTGTKHDSIQIGSDLPWTDAMLLLFGPDVKKEHADAFNLSPISHYITKEGFKIEATEDYHIFYYNYGKFGKIYQPFNPEFRFIYVGTKPDSTIFADNRTAKLLKKVSKHEAPADPNDDYSDPGEIGGLVDLIICTGPSDAINVFAQGYPVVWMNSETGIFSDYQYHLLKKLLYKKINSKDIIPDGQLYLLPDIDVTGIRMATKIATQYLDIRIIWLPDRLNQYKTDKGKPCKDVRDMFRFYRDDRYDKNSYLFKRLVQTAQPLMFWNRTYDDDGFPKGYEINNECVYSFLKSNGFFTIDTKSNKNEFTFVHIKENVVKEISHARIVEYINNFLISYIKHNLQYYDIKLINAIHRTNQLKLASISKLPRIKLDTVSYGPGYDHLFFKYFAVKVTADGVEPIRWINVEKTVAENKIIDFNFKKLDAPFTIEYDPTYKQMLDDALILEKTKPQSKEALEARKHANNDIPPYARFILDIKDNDFSLIKYIMNTSRFYWEKEEKGIELTITEKYEQNLGFINKVCALGYALFRYKEPSRAWAIYAMESDENIETGKSQGGTGKSFFLKLVSLVRNTLLIDGQKKSLSEDKLLFGRVLEGTTDYIIIDDLGLHVPIKILFVPITGDMMIEPKFIETYAIGFDSSPKIGFTSNHPLKNIDASMRRRLFFAGFSSYYHGEDPIKSVHERSMRTEFGKELIKDYTPEEMNKTYNFLAYCLHTYMKFHERINPPMEGIEKRNMQHSMGDDFLYWAEDYFDESRLDTRVEKNEAFEAFRSTLPDSDKKWFKPRIFKERLMLYAHYKGYEFNPKSLMVSESEKKRNDIRGTKDGIDVYYFYFDTKNAK